MHRELRSLIISIAVALGLLALTPSPVLASDYGPMVMHALGIFALIVGIALILGFATSAVLVWVYRRKRIWFLIPVFAVVWFVVIFGAWQLWMNVLSADARRYRNWKPPNQPVQIPVIEPEHDMPVPEEQDLPLPEAESSNR